MATPLTALDIKALRTADSIVFRTTDGAFRTTDGDSTIETCKHVRSSKSDPFRQDPQRLYYDIAVQSAGAKNAWHHIMFADTCAEWQTIARSLHPGDILTLRWVKDGQTTDYARVASYVGERTVLNRYSERIDPPSFTSLHCDVLRLMVQRGKQVYTYLLGVSCTPANSARMIQE